MKTTRRMSHSIEPLENRTMLTGALVYGFGLGVKQVDVATDDQGNAYVVGTFKGTVDFNPSPRRQWLATAANANGDMFVARFNANGALAWVVTLGDATNAPAPTGITTLAWGTNAGVWVAGSFSGTQDFNPSAGVFNMTPIGGKDMFILGLTENGAFKVANRVGTANDDVPVDITIDGLYRLYVAGTTTGGANTEAFAGQFTGRGKVIGTRTWATTGVDITPTAITADGEGDFFMAGDVSGDFTFSGATGGTVTGPTTFLLKLDTGGGFAWVNSIQGAHIRALSTDRLASAGPFSVIAAGSFSGKIDVDTDPAVSHPLTSRGGTDAFAVKYDANGAYLWRTSMGGAGDDVALSVDGDAGGAMYIGGLFRQTATFWRTTTLTSRGGTDAFAVKFDFSGRQRYLDQFGGTGDDQISHLAIGVGANIFALGPLIASGNYSPFGTTFTLAPIAGHTEDTFLIELD